MSGSAQDLPATEHQLTASHHSASGQRSHTPCAQRISSTRVSNHQPPCTVDNFDKMVNQELHDASFHDDTLPNRIFSDEVLGFKVDANICSMIQFPTERTEKAIAKCFNAFGKKLAKKLNRPVVRHWVTSQSGKAPEGSSLQRKPDLALVGKGKSASHWKRIQAIAETTFRPTSERVDATARQKAFIIFETQPNRRFVPSIAIYGDKVRFILHDRAGELYAKIKINQGSEMFVRFLAGLMLSDSCTDLGYDETMVIDKAENVVKICVGGLDYKVIAPLFKSQTLRGRATQCWHVERDGKKYIIKDSWIDRSRQQNETDFLTLLDSLEGVPDLIAGEDVKLPSGDLDCTLPRTGQNVEARVHRRLVLSPVAEHLSTFRSKKELVGAFIDVLQGKILY